MSTVPPYLGEFGENDVRWFHENGTRLHVRAGERVITEGVMPEHIFVVLEGEFQVSSVGMNDPDMMRAREGELLGEMSYINRVPPGASVDAVVDGQLLAVLRTNVDAKIKRDPEFGSRFRKAVMDCAFDRVWLYNRRNWDPPPPQPPPDPYAGLRVHELIEKLLRGEFPDEGTPRDGKDKKDGNAGKDRRKRPPG